MNDYIANVVSSKEDWRDYNYSPTLKESQLLRRLDGESNVRNRRSQGAIGSCAPHGILSCCEDKTADNGVDYDGSELFLYNATKAKYNRLGEEGLVVRNCLKVANKIGCCTESAWPYDISKDNIKPPERAYREASQWKLDRYEAVVAPMSRETSAQKIYKIKAALQEGLHVVAAVTISKSIFSQSGPWERHNYEKVNSTNGAGGHLVRFIGFDDDSSKIQFLNSWKNWGDNWLGGFPYWIVDEPWFECWVIRSFAGLEVKEPPGIKPELIGDFGIRAKLVPKPEEVGTKANIWMGAVSVDGKVFIRAPYWSGLPDKKLQHHHIIPDPEKPFSIIQSGGVDNWMPWTGEEIQPVISNYPLKEQNLLEVVKWMNLKVFSGAQIFVSYGKNLNTAFLVPLTKIP